MSCGFSERPCPRASTPITVKPSATSRSTIPVRNQLTRVSTANPWLRITGPKPSSGPQISKEMASPSKDVKVCDRFRARLRTRRAEVFRLCRITRLTLSCCARPWADDPAPVWSTVCSGLMSDADFDDDQYPEEVFIRTCGRCGRQTAPRWSESSSLEEARRHGWRRIADSDRPGARRLDVCGQCAGDAGLGGPIAHRGWY